MCYWNAGAGRGGIGVWFRSFQRENRGKMPTYSYECKKCAHVLDVFHSMSENPRQKCPECGGAMRRLIGAGAGVIFKGSGFYETDYKKNGSSKGGNGAAKSESGGESKAETKSESKSEPKPAAKPASGSKAD